MPKFRAELEEYRSGFKQHDSLVGNLYRILIAPPKNRNGGPSRDAFFYPGDTGTYMGQAMARKFGLETKPDDEIIVLTLRSLDPAESHQLDLQVRVGDISIRQTGDPEYVKIGDDVISQRLEPDCGVPILYASAPTVVILTDKLHIKNPELSSCYEPA